MLGAGRPTGLVSPLSHDSSFFLSSLWVDFFWMNEPDLMHDAWDALESNSAITINQSVSPGLHCGCSPTLPLHSRSFPALPPPRLPTTPPPLSLSPPSSSSRFLPRCLFPPALYSLPLLSSPTLSPSLKITPPLSLLFLLLEKIEKPPSPGLKLLFPNPTLSLLSSRLLSPLSPPLSSSPLPLPFLPCSYLCVRCATAGRPCSRCCPVAPTSPRPTLLRAFSQGSRICSSRLSRFSRPRCPQPRCHRSRHTNGQLYPHRCTGGGAVLQMQRRQPQLQPLFPA